ncbi:MAG: PDZ domain-containing protein [Bacteriovoracaceae bacterium]|jgi:carboxyl-terminal processing protease|nr:PDZ domain-containing protein [Bacteriovoracaceae bacterium]
MTKLVLLLTLLIGNVYSKSIDKSLFEKTVTTIKSTNYHNLSDKEIYEAALKGVLKHIESKNKVDKKLMSFRGDANILLPPRNANELKSEIAGEISGIGVVMEFEKDKGQKYPLIKKVLTQGGAKKAGLKKGDQILKIEGASTSKENSFRDIVYKIRGKTNTNVKLTILRDESIFVKRIKRKKINWEAAELESIEGNLAHIRLSYFNKKTAGKLEDILKKLKSKNVKSLVIDLRGNQGGIFDEGVKAAKLFAKKGQTVLTAKYSKAKVEKLKADRDGIGLGFNIALIIGRDTKSMGEAIAMALKSFGNSTIIGEKSYGKATMETLLELDSGHTVKYTVGKLFDANGQTWDISGITPDIVIPNQNGESGFDYQLNLAKKYLARP